MTHRNGVYRAIEALASTQFGVFSRAQAIDLGATGRMIDPRVASGLWQRLFSGVYRVAGVPKSPRQAAMAAALWSAPDGLVSHLYAAAFWRFERISADRLDVSVPASRHLRSEFVVVHRVRDLLPADIARRGPIPVTSALRTAIDLAGVVDADVLEIAIESALRQGLFTTGQLRWRADALMGTGRPGSQALRQLLTSRDLGQTESGWEVRTAKLLEGAGLGRPVRQHRIRANGKPIARVDLAYPAAHLVIEYDSDQWHTGVVRRHDDADRRNQLRAAGWTVVEVTAAQLRHPAQLLELVRTLLAA